MKTLTKESIIEVLEKYGENKMFGKYVSYIDFDGIADELFALQQPEQEGIKSAEKYMEDHSQKPNHNGQYCLYPKVLYGYMIDFASQFQQPEITDEKIKKALENLIFTAGKLWDEVKPIKDTEIRIVTHPIIEEAKIVLASLTLQAQQPSDDNIEKWMDTEYPLYKYPKSRKERKVNTMTCLVRDGIRYSLKAMREGKIPRKK